MSKLTRRTVITSSTATGAVVAAAQGVEAQTAGSTLATVDDLRRATGLPEGATVALQGYLHPGDGGAGLWRVHAPGITPPDEVCSIALADGQVGRLTRALRYDVRQAGIFSNTPGAETARRLRALVTHVVAAGGGEIGFAQPIACGNVTFPPIPRDAAVVFYMLPWVSVQPSDPQPGVFMWEFPNGPENITAPNFINVKILGNRQNRPRCNGIRVGPTNLMTVDNCSAMFIDGCAWQIETANNARIDITTFRCGSEDGTYAQNYVTDARRGIGCNDIVLEGTTEDDFFGINIEAAAIIRDGSAIKLHGGSNTRRALRLHRCLAFALRVFASQRWNADGFIHVSDTANSAGERLVAEAERGGQNTRGRLEIDTMFNIRWGGPAVSETGEIPGWCVLDLQDPASAVMVTGLIHPQARPVDENARYVHVRIAGPGNPGVTCDIDGLRFANRVARAVRLQDDRRAAIVARGRTLGAQDADPVAPRAFSDPRNGRIDLRGHDFVDVEAGVEISQILLEIGQTCTICAPLGEVRVQSGDMLRLAGGRDVEMTPDTTLTLRRVAPDRIHEIARSGG